MSDNCYKNLNGTNSLYDGIDGYTNKYNIYLIDAKDLGSKQCRCEIETMGKLPDNLAIQEKRDVPRGGNLRAG